MKRHEVTSFHGVSWYFMEHNNWVGLVEQVQGRQGRQFIMDLFRDERGRISTIRIETPQPDVVNGYTIYGYGTNGQQTKMGSAYGVESEPINPSAAFQSRLFRDGQLPDGLDIERTGQEFLRQMKRGDVGRPILYPAYVFSSSVALDADRLAFWGATTDALLRAT